MKIQCDVYPVYRDPVHDFGILRFDPKAIKYMPLTSLELKPDMARKCCDIRLYHICSTKSGLRCGCRDQGGGK